MPGMDGMELLRRAHELDPALPVIVITAFATIESAVAAVKEGAFDYLPKNFSVEQLRVAVERALRQRELQVENRNLREQLQQALGLENIIGRSPAMAQVFELVKKAARSEANILVLGESGTGKELIARAIHANSPRAAQAFVPVDCASLPEHLLESELFGHEKGAFTGAVRSKPGLMEVAHRGTLFLDEIGELPAGAPGQAAPGAPGAADPARGRHRARRGGRARGVGHQPRPARRHRPRASSARSSTTGST